MSDRLPGTLVKPTRPKDALSALEEEFREERAAALGRIVRTLDGYLDDLRRLGAEIAVADADHRPALVAEYREVREKAKTWSWYLVVQREAMGLRNTEELAQCYPIPPDVKD